MHDIICPKCGNKFLGRECSFDLSEFIVRMLCTEEDNLDEITKAGFRFVVTEDEILLANPDEDSSKIISTTKSGPSSSDECFRFPVTYDLLYNYVLEHSDINERAFVNILESLSEAVEFAAFDDISDADARSMVNMFVSLFKPIAFGTDEVVNFDDQIVRNAARVLVNIYNAKKAGDSEREITLYVQTHSLNKNRRANERIPDMLFVWSCGRGKVIPKSCGRCGTELPDEFGYYRMKSVVLWGAHSSGKTSFLISMLDMVTTSPMFVLDERVAARTLTNDRWAESYKNNLKHYQKGFAPDKTDLDNVPILNLLVGDTILSFIDWPGEAFIKEEKYNELEGSGVNYVYDFRPVVASASHVMFFIPPAQVDSAICGTEPEEGVVFDIPTLTERLKQHLGVTDSNRFKSLMFILNKADLTLSNRDMVSDEFISLIESSSLLENKLYSFGQWDESVLESIETQTCNGYFNQKSATLYRLLNSINIDNAAGARKYFIPVKPYGFAAEKYSEEKTKKSVNHRGSLQGIPYLIILRAEGII